MLYLFVLTGAGMLSVSNINDDQYHHVNVVFVFKTSQCLPLTVQCCFSSMMLRCYN